MPSNLLNIQEKDLNDAGSFGLLHFTENGPKHQVEVITQTGPHLRDQHRHQTTNIRRRVLGGLRVEQLANDFDNVVDAITICSMRNIQDINNILVTPSRGYTRPKSNGLYLEHSTIVRLYEK